MRATRRGVDDSTEERATKRAAGTPDRNISRGPELQGKREGATDAVVAQGRVGDPVPDRPRGNKDSIEGEGAEPDSRAGRTDAVQPGRSTIRPEPPTAGQGPDQEVALTSPHTPARAPRLGSGRGGNMFSSLQGD